MSEADRNWLLRAQQGDEQAFARLVEQYQAQVYNLCYRMLGDPFEAEDAAQEAFLRAYKAIRRYDPDRPFATWILTIASRYCIDRLRRRRLQTFSIDPFLENGIPGRDLGPEGRLVQQEQQDRIQALLSTLKPVEKAAVVMRYWYEFSYEEIAESLSLTVSAVKSRLHRARRELAKEYQSQAVAQGSDRFVSERKRHGSPAY